MLVSHREGEWGGVSRRCGPSPWEKKLSPWSMSLVIIPSKSLRFCSGKSLKSGNRQRTDSRDGNQGGKFPPCLWDKLQYGILDFQCVAWLF
ncbi:hypothetical protein GDO81_021962 [Engystomops pustulosus]|uniref:Uncharacterized protein n=1 Tax=Engystomops pustulosus TaxID=76066 RepID=A0AAV6ZT66_ENGPU|nr:hypothetical protein GDO81_021962 [Engystomops pustulosus]